MKYIFVRRVTVLYALSKYFFKSLKGKSIYLLLTEEN